MGPVFQDVEEVVSGEGEEGDEAPGEAEGEGEEGDDVRCVFG